jgi:hypothetical protein
MAHGYGARQPVFPLAAALVAAEILFKTGGENGGNDPYFFAFRLLPGFDNTFPIQVTYSIVGGNAKLSNTRLVGNQDDFREVPIPAAVWLLGSGLLGLFAVGRSRGITAIRR